MRCDVPARRQHSVGLGSCVVQVRRGRVLPHRLDTRPTGPTGLVVLTRRGHLHVGGDQVEFGTPSGAGVRRATSQPCPLLLAGCPCLQAFYPRRGFGQPARGSPRRGARRLIVRLLGQAMEFGVQAVSPGSTSDLARCSRTACRRAPEAAGLHLHHKRLHDRHGARLRRTPGEGMAGALATVSCRCVIKSGDGSAVSGC